MELKAIELHDSYLEAAKRAKYYAVEHEEMTGLAPYGDRWSVLVGSETHHKVMLRIIGYANRLNAANEINEEEVELDESGYFWAEYGDEGAGSDWRWSEDGNLLNVADHEEISQAPDDEGSVAKQEHDGWQDGYDF